MRRQIHAVTLIELLIAITLMSVIILGLTNIDLFSRYHLLSSERRSRLQNEVSTALEHMTKQISRAIGDYNQPAVKKYTDHKGIRIRIDDNPPNGMVDATDHWIAYRHIDSEIWFYLNAGESETPAGDPEIIARKIVPVSGLEFSGNFDAISGWLNDSIIQVKITSRWQPAQAASSDNPEVTMTTRIKMPAVSSTSISTPPIITIN